MTHRQLSALTLIATVVLCFGLAHAQQNNATPQNAQTTEAHLREKAFDLLESLAGQISTLQSAENRARLASNIAESLWNHDETRARTLLVSVEEDIKAGLQNADGDDPSDMQTRVVFLQLRVDTVERIARHDPELALAFLRTTELGSDKPRPYGDAQTERDLELRLAKAIAADNPDFALKLGRQSLARGFSADLVSLLAQLHRKHREQALILYKEIISKLRNADLARDPVASEFGENLAHSFSPPAADESTFRELIGMFITSALENGCGAKLSDEDERTEFCNQIGSLLPQMERIDPLRAARLKHWTPEDPEPHWSPEAYNELSDLTEHGTVDDMLALAKKYPQMEDEISWQAMLKAEGLGDIARAKKIATDYGRDPERQRIMLAQIDRDQMWVSITDQRLAEVQTILGTVPRIQERVAFLLYVANQIGGNNPKAALKLLNQAYEIVDTMKPGKEQTEAQMALATSYCSEKSDRGLAIMESLMPKLNDLVAASVKLDGYDNRYLRDGEWNMTGEGSVGNLLTRLSQNAGLFAWCDFDRAVTLAAQFERPELRLMAQLKLAQGILNGPPRRLLMGGLPMRY